MSMSQSRVGRFIQEATHEGQILNIPLFFGRYEYIRTIGIGARSVVIVARNRMTGSDYAVKVVSRKIFEDPYIAEYFERELRLLESVRHTCLIEHYETIYLDDLILIVTEYCRNGDLFQLIKTNRESCASLARPIIYQVLKGLEYLHSRNCVHRDIKPENIFIGESNTVKIGDLGLAKQSHDLMNTMCGTLFYQAPEILLEKPYGTKADIWAVGVITYVMMLNTLPWKPGSDAEIIKDIVEGHIEIPVTLPAKVAKFIEACTRKNPAERASATELLNMPWMQDEKPVWEQCISKQNKTKVSPVRSLPGKTLLVRPFLSIKPETVAGSTTALMTSPQGTVRSVRFRVRASASSGTPLRLTGKFQPM